MKATLMTLMAMQYLNAPYRWGANGPFEFDCSGLSGRVLHDVGITLPDMTANQQMEWCERNAHISDEKTCDSLIFFGKNGKATHVAISIGVIDDVWWMIEAGGAGRNSKDMTIEELGKIDARVRIKPVSNRKDLLASYVIPYRRKL